MAKMKSEGYEAQVRTPAQEVLASAVRTAALAAARALRLAVADRRALHKVEWHRRDQDTLGDIDEAADTLQGFAAWALNGSLHPQPQRVVAKLSRMKSVLEVDLDRRFNRAGFEYKKLSAYLERLQELRDVLERYFRREVRGASLPAGGHRVRRSA